MKARTPFYIHINNDKDPGHNDYIRNEYELREEAKKANPPIEKIYFMSELM